MRASMTSGGILVLIYFASTIVEDYFLWLVVDINVGFPLVGR